MGTDRRIPDVKAFDNYRDFIRSWMDLNHVSNRGLAARFPKVVSVPAIAKLLSRGRGKEKRESIYSISPEKLAQLLRSMGLSEEETTFIVLLRLENDSVVFPGMYGGAYRILLQAMIKGFSFEKKVESTKALPAEVQALAELYAKLPPHAKKKAKEDLVEHAKIALSRMNGKPGARGLQQALSVLRSS